MGKVLSIMSTPLQAKQLIRSTISMFIVGWEMQCDKKRPQLWQLMIGSFITTMCLLMHNVSYRFFWWQIKLLRWLRPLQPRFGALWLLAFPKTKITFEWEEILDHQWDSGQYDEATDGDWENCVRSQLAYFEGDWGVIVLCTMFLVSSSRNVSIFHSTWLDTFWTTSFIPIYVLMCFILFF